MNSHQFENAADALLFLKAGRATVTLVSKTSGVRYTYQITEVRYPTKPYPFLFVSVMYGPDNKTHYLYMGTLSSSGLVLTPKSRVSSSDKRFLAFNWLFNKLTKGILPDKVEIWHEGRCGHCGKKLTVPESIQRGIGPICYRTLIDSTERV